MDQESGVLNFNRVARVVYGPGSTEHIATVAFERGLERALLPPLGRLHHRRILRKSLNCLVTVTWVRFQAALSMSVKTVCAN